MQHFTTTELIHLKKYMSENVPNDLIGGRIEGLSAFQEHWLEQWNTLHLSSMIKVVFLSVLLSICLEHRVMERGNLMELEVLSKIKFIP